VTPVNDPRRDGKILVAVGLAGSQLVRGGHRGQGYVDLDCNWASCRLRNTGRQDRPRPPYRGNCGLNQCYLSPFSHAEDRSPLSHRNKRRASGGTVLRPYCPWLTSTALQAFEIFGRFC
jgi:hypothetical protein